MTPVALAIKIRQSHKNIILTGAPGTGKTHLARELASILIGCDPHEVGRHNQFHFVQFHPSYDYTDFVEGLKPTMKSTDNGSISFELRKGIFRIFCENAANDTDSNNKYIFVIDEINRADLSRVFGELFFALEPNYRGKLGVVTTQYSSMYEEEKDKLFHVPENVYLIGTMNDIDRSVESIDFALRRRFAWHEVTADESLFVRLTADIFTLKPEIKNEAQRRYIALNKLIKAELGLGESYCVGPAYFRKLVDYFEEDKIDWEAFWSYHLEPLIKEYLRGTNDAAKNMDKFKNAYSNPSN